MSRFLSPQQRFGTGAPANALGINGDSYLDLASGTTYTKASGAWTSGGSLAPSAGLTRYGTGAPANGTGNVGDYYVDEATGNLYGPKRSTAVTFVASAVSNAAAVTVPAQTTAGMLMVLFIDSWYANPSAPAGWTTLANTDASNGGGGRYAYYGTYYKIATASDAGTAVPNASGNSNSEMTLVVYSSAGAPTYLNGSAVSNTNATGAPPTSVTLPAETLKGSGDLALAAVGYTDQASPTNLVISGPAGSTLRGATSGSNGRGFAITFAELPASGTSVAASTFTIANQTTTTSNTQGFQGMVLDVPLSANAWPLLSNFPGLAAGSGTTKWIASKTSAYTAAAGDAVPCDTTGGTFAVTLNSGLANGAPVRVKWKAGTAAPTVVAANGVTIDTTWTGFGTVGDDVDFSLNSITNVWEVV